jgi:thiamine-monophosphate kinase
MDGLDEFEVIRALFAPLATAAEARGLLDDAAVLAPPGRIVLTTDAIVEGVHFLPQDPLDTIAQKALRVNLSDLAAKAARPLGYLLTLCWPRTRPAAGLALFAAGLARDQSRFGLSLLGGDTVSTPGPLTVSITALGALEEGADAPDRRGGAPGQDLWVSGAIGDGWLGLQAAQGGLSELGFAERAALVARYRLPEPRLELAGLLRAHARAALDVSDGLAADAAKLARASGCAVELWLEALPLSTAGAAYVGAPPKPGRLLQLANGGDDYEVLFSADPGARPVLEAAALDSLRLRRIGRLLEGTGAVLRDGAGQAIEAASGGFAHRLGC